VPQESSTQTDAWLRSFKNITFTNLRDGKAPGKKKKIKKSSRNLKQNLGQVSDGKKKASYTDNSQGEALGETRKSNWLEGNRRSRHHVGWFEREPSDRKPTREAGVGG